MSYSGYKSSPRGSRGGGYRGGGYRGSRGGDGGGWRGQSRGYAGSSRGSGRGGSFSRGGGGGKWDRDDSNMYESRSRYSGGGGDRTSHSREEGGSYRYRGGDESGSYSSREHSHRGSPDRKRMRAEYSPASSMHRSHDYSDGMEYSSRSYGGGYEGKRMSSYGGSDERRVSSFREERERIRSDDYQFRKPLNISGPRHSTPRGSSYRGRSSFSRGLRSTFRRYEPTPRAEPFMRKRSAVGSYGIRKPMGRTQEYLRRLKLYRIQRLRRLRERVAKEGSDDDEDAEEEEVEEEEEIEEEVTDEDAEEQEKDDDEKVKKDDENEDEEMEVEGEEKKDTDKKKKKIKKVVKVIKKIKRKVPKKTDGDKEKDESEENKELQVTVKQDSEGRDVDGPGSGRKNYLGQPYIKLECPHCLTTCETFKDYMHHLSKNKHQMAMVAITARVSKALGKLRMEQRAEQKDIDEEAKLKNPNMRTFFCLTCKLNFRSLKSEHLHSQKHKEIVKFLNPYCKICRVTAKSPMQYENHICSLFHLKRKFFYEKKNAENVEGSEIDMDNFMVLDQVGSGEDEEESESDEKDGDENAEKEGKEGEEGGEGEGDKPKEKKVKKKKKQINLGSEYCKKINIYFCELCKTFLPRIEDQEQALAVHCRGSLHLRCYVKKKDDLALRKRAERIHRMREAQRKAELKDEGKDEGGDEEGNAEDKAKKPSEIKIETDDKPSELSEEAWGLVSQDLNELIEESDKTKVEDSDDDEDSRTTGRRYDRFKHSEKAKGAGGEAESGEEKTGVVNGDEDKDA